jgi:hypothetical protein
MPSKQMDELTKILDLIERLTGLEPTDFIQPVFYDNYRKEARAAIERMVGERIDKALDAADDWLNGALYAGLGRGETIKRLTTPTEDKQND